MYFGEELLEYAKNTQGLVQLRASYVMKLRSLLGIKVIEGDTSTAWDFACQSSHAMHLLRLRPTTKLWSKLGQKEGTEEVWIMGRAVISLTFTSFVVTFCVIFWTFGISWCHQDTRICFLHYVVVLLLESRACKNQRPCVTWHHCWSGFTNSTARFSVLSKKRQIKGSQLKDRQPMQRNTNQRRTK